MKRIAVMTTGGDAPGMNAAIRAVVRAASNKKVDIFGVYRGYWGLINEELKLMDRRSVSGIINQGGTILKTLRCPEFHTDEGKRRAFETLRKNDIEGIIVIGGNGSFIAADSFTRLFGVKCIGVPASIDNDVGGVEETIGADTAINTALAAIDNIRDTATSLERVFVVEVMGRDCGYIALHVALASGCEDVITPERPFDMSAICHDIVNGNIRGKASWIIVVAEGAGSAPEIARRITDHTSLETRAVVFGHIQRGGRPTARSRMMALALGEAAVEYLLRGESQKVVSLSNGMVNAVDFATAIKKKEYDVERLYGLIRRLS